MDFAKFVWTLEHSKLYFCRLDKLPDPLEGRLPSSMRSIPVDTPEASARAIVGFNNFMETFTRTAYYVNCWHVSRFESVAMWQYGRNEYGIALRSRYSRLLKSFSGESRKIHIGAVAYLDGCVEQTSPVRPADLALRKEPCWEYERELRAVVMRSMEEDGDGLKVSVDLTELIECVIVAPKAPAWFGDLVATVMRRYDLAQVSVVPSNILREPASLEGPQGPTCARR